MTSNRSHRHVAGRSVVVGAAFFPILVYTWISEAATLYVARDGQIHWSGGLSAPNADRSDGPLPSIEAARDRIRSRRAKGDWLNEEITVYVRGGMYVLSKPLVFGPQDSGAAGRPVVYAAFEQETPILSGGRVIRGWRTAELHGRFVWAVQIPEVKQGRWYFRQLFVDGHRRMRPRVPKEGYYQITGLPETPDRTTRQSTHDEAYFRPGDLRNWHDLDNVEFVSLEKWDESHLFMQRVDETAHRVKFTQKSYFKLGSTPEGGVYVRYYLKNVFEALDSPGQWYLDRPKGALYYMPMPGETHEKTTVIAPRLDELVRIAGDADGHQAVHDLHLKGMVFCHSDWFLPPDSRGGGQAATRVPAAVSLGHAERCRIVDCTVKQISTYAIEVGGGCKDTTISGCTLTDLGAGGIKVGHDGSFTTVADNEISNGGLIHHGAVGVWIGHSWDNTVAHNHIHHLYYTGISVGWVWGYGESKAVRNAIEYNHIHHIGQGLLSDMGGIYTLGPSAGTRLCHNLIHDVEAYAYGGYGLYNDEGSTGVLLENNIVYRTSHGGYHQHYGKENVIRNNILAYGRKSDVTRSRQEGHLSFTFERNIVYIVLPRIFGGEWQWDKGNFRMDRNLYYREGGKWFDFPGDRTFRQWQREYGQDARSIIADPMFVDPENGDFTLKPDSPAKQIGFQPIDTSSIGPRKGD